MTKGKLLLLFFLMSLGACGYRGHQQEQGRAAVSKNQSELGEESRALTTGVVDALTAATNSEPAIDLAREFAQRDQQIEGMPVERIPVKDILAGLKPALDALQKRFDRQEQLLREKAAVEAKLRDTEAKLIEMGKLYEQDKNKHIIRRIWEWALSTLGIGGIIVLCVFCPAVIPLLGSIAGWIVSKIPQLAGFFRIVGVGAWQAAVKGVGNAREALKAAGHTEQLKILDNSLKKTTEDENYHRPLVDATRAKLAV